MQQKKNTTLTTSTANGRAAHTIPTLMKRITMMLALIVSFALGARAADYVITYTNGGTTYYLGMNDNSLQAKTTFDITCVWTCINGNSETTLGKNNSRSLCNRNNSDYYLTTSCKQQGNWNNYTYTWEPLSVQTSASNIWRSSNATNGNVYAYYSFNYGLNRSASINVQSLSMIDNNTNSSKNGLVTITQVSTTSTNPTINGNAVLTATGNYTYTASGAAYQAGGYTNYRFDDKDHYLLDNNNTAITPEAATLSETTWSLTANDYATINNSGAVTVNSIPTSDVTLTITATVSVTDGIPTAPAGTTLVGTKEITIQGSVPAAPTISVSGTTVTLQTDATGTTSIRYTIDGTEPTATSGTVYNGTFDISGSTNSPVTIKAITIRNGNVSSVTTQQVKLTLPEPVITVNATAGTATITCSNSSATIYYTTDGSTPSATNGTRYNGQITGLATMATVKAIAICDGWNSSSVASATVTIPSGVSSEGTVTLFDYEDHTWSYYSDPDCPIHSWNPADVKITYYGNGSSTVATTNDDNPTSFTADATGVKVGIDADANTFVYYKTLERTDGSTAAAPSAATGRCAYTTIPNPFSVRPTYGSGDTRWRGFYKWRVKKVSGGTIHSASAGGATYAQGSTIDAEEDIYFAPNSEYGMEVEFEALWARAYVSTSGAKNYNVGVERNFYVLTSSTNNNITAGENPCTYTSIYPNGTTDGTITATSISVYRYGGFSAKTDSKIEYIILRNNNSTISANGKNLTIGRGVLGYNNGLCANIIKGLDANNSEAFHFRLESGTYNNLYFMGNSGQKSNIMMTTVGSDFDRANSDNSKLKINDDILLSNGGTPGSSGQSGSEIFNCTIKSGNFDLGDYGGDVQFYFSSPGSSNYGLRKILIEGGVFSDVSGGMENNDNGNVLTFDLRIVGGLINGATYGAAQNAAASGNRRFIITGGDFKGWIAGGANGTRTTGGALDGTTQIYFGGDATCISANNNTIGPGNAIGGNIFGAGSGNANANVSATVGQVTSSTIVIADKCEVEHCVYGGGNYGFVSDGETNKSEIFILGGIVDEMVFGGSNNQRGQNVEITMTDGLVKKGVYGGCNTTGTIRYNVTMQINGGQVGTTSQTANIHGGGYGQDTQVSGNVEVTLGTTGQTTEGVEVWGDVYGGSALGTVNSDASDHTYVTMYKGTINGSLYGGGLGSASVAANVNGPVKVEVHGGSVKATSAAGSGGVYGANNIKGAPQRSVTVDIYRTDPAPAEGEYALYAVYGGGNQADYLYNGYPTVTVHGCDNSIEYIYGGGNAAAVAATDVTIYGGDVIGNVFGGGNGTVSAANVTGSTSTTIYGGTILNVYGGSNSQGTIGGDINLLVNSQAEEGKDLCPMNIVNVFGGGNQAASKAGNISIVCTGDKGYIENVYGGANQANITGDIDLYINGGNIGNVFGGNNESGNISGNITVTVGNAPNEDCGIFEIGNVYGGGNLAAYSNGNGYPIVNMQGGTVREAIFGGGYGESATVTGNPQVNVSGGIVGSVVTNDGTQTILGDIYGGGNMAPLIGNPVVTLSNNANVWSRVFGGGNNALVTGKTNVTMSGGVVGYTEKVGERDVVRGGDIFGGGNAATIEGETNVHITNGRIGHNVYGGGNEGNVTGKTNVKVGE